MPPVGSAPEGVRPNRAVDRNGAAVGQIQDFHAGQSDRAQAGARDGLLGRVAGGEHRGAAGVAKDQGRHQREGRGRQQGRCGERAVAAHAGHSALQAMPGDARRRPADRNRWGRSDRDLPQSGAGDA